MFDYPKQAELNRVVPKAKVYDRAKPSRAIRSRFVSQVSEIVWKYKLSPETVNLPARLGIQEIQVFAIALKTGELSGDVLRTLDKTIPSPIFYELTFEERVRFTAAYKRPTDNGASKSFVDAYYETGWQPVTAARPPLPVALDLAGLYEQMLRAHMAGKRHVRPEALGDRSHRRSARQGTGCMKKPDVRAIRAKMGLSQSDSPRATRSVSGRLQQWEQGRREPESAGERVLAYFKVIERNPESVKRALQG